MTTGLKTKAAGNADLDAVFDPYVQGTSPPATGLNVGGTTTDINTRYAPIVYGSAAAATGWNTKQTGNADLNTLFAAYGTATYSIPGIQGATYSVSATASGVSGHPGASVNMALAFNSDGTYSFTGTVVSGGGSGGTIVGLPASGTWLPSGWVAANCDIQISYVETILETGGASKINPMASYVSLASTQTFSMSAACAATSPNGNGSRLAMTLLIKNTTTGAVMTTTFTAICNAAPGV